MNSQTAFRIAAILGFLAVALGAFGAHGSLHDMVEKNGRLATWDTAVLYHLTHSIVLLVIATLRPFRCLAWLLMLVGVALFSGSLYVIALTNINWIGKAITPFGGTCLLIGWLVLAFGKADDK